MNELQVFKNSEFGEIRTTTIENEPWLVGKDVATALGYTNTRKAIGDHVDEHDVTKRYPIIDSLNRPQEVTIINESGMYSLILSSKLPTARKFKHWVTSNVLPTIRKHGMYATPQTIEDMLQDPDTMIKTLQTLKEERQKRVQAETQIEEQKPKVLFAETCQKSKDSILVRELAKVISKNGKEIGEKRLYQWLRSFGYVYQAGGKNLPYQRYIKQGLFEVKEVPYKTPSGGVHLTLTTMITPKGQAYIINKLS